MNVQDMWNRKYGAGIHAVS